MSEASDQVRLLIGDRGDDPHYTDDELEGYLAIEGDDVRLAAAAALEAWAAELSANAHDVQLGDYREATWHAAQEMGRRAKALREAAVNTPAFAVAEVAWDGPFGFAGRDILTNAALRGDL